MAVFRPEIASSGIDGFEGFFLRREERDVFSAGERRDHFSHHLETPRAERRGLFYELAVALGEIDHELHRFHIVGSVKFAEIEKDFHLLPCFRKTLLDDAFRRSDGSFQGIDVLLREGAADFEEYVPLRFNGYLQWFVHTFYCLNQT